MFLFVFVNNIKNLNFKITYFLLNFTLWTLIFNFKNKVELILMIIKGEISKINTIKIAITKVIKIKHHLMIEITKIKETILTIDKLVMARMILDITSKIKETILTVNKSISTEMCRIGIKDKKY